MNEGILLSHWLSGNNLSIGAVSQENKHQTSTTNNQFKVTPKHHSCWLATTWEIMGGFQWKLH